MHAACGAALRRNTFRLSAFQRTSHEQPQGVNITTWYKLANFNPTVDSTSSVDPAPGVTKATAFLGVIIICSVKVDVKHRLHCLV